MKKNEKSEKKDLNFASLCFTSKQKSLNRSKAKNLKRKKRKNAKKNAKKAEKTEKSEEKKRKKVKKNEKIDLNFASLHLASK